MTKNKDADRAKPTKRRTQVKDLPQSEKELSKDKQKKLKGGPSYGIGCRQSDRSGGSGSDR